VERGDLINRNAAVELIIPTYNRLRILGQTLRQVRVLYPDLAICVGLQGEMPDKEFEAHLLRDPHLRIEKLPEPGTTRALNHCIGTSRADIVLSLDDDAVPCTGWLEAHLGAFSEEDALAYTSGRIVELKRGRSSLSELIRILAEWACAFYLSGSKRAGGRIVGWMNSLGLILANYDRPGNCRINAPREGNMAIRRELFLKAGGFRETFRGNAWGFGAEFGARLAKQGSLGRYVGNAVILHQEVSSGGSRQGDRRKWYADFLHNHRVLMETIGVQGWIGSIPRLLKKRFFTP
jgi:GT2 family glycosyltransferase